MSDSEKQRPYKTRDEGFRAWLAMNDYLLDCEFLAGDVPGMPDEPYGDAGLLVAEGNALTRFGGYREALLPENRAMFDKYVRFVGEVFVRALDGSWTDQPLVDDGAAFIGVQFPWREYTVEIPPLITSALNRRTGTHWARVLGNLTKERNKALGT